MTYAFPTTFKVQVEEYQVFGYYVTEEDHYPFREWRSRGDTGCYGSASQVLPKRSFF